MVNILSEISEKIPGKFQESPITIEKWSLFIRPFAYYEEK